MDYLTYLGTMALVMIAVIVFLVSDSDWPVIGFICPPLRNACGACGLATVRHVTPSAHRHICLLGTSLISELVCGCQVNG